MLHFHPASLPMSLWFDSNDRHSDSHILSAILRPGDIYVDVGANVGHLAIEAALIVGNSGRVAAFEAHPRTVNFLRQNIQLNQLNNIRVAQVAVGASCGWVGFTDNDSDDQNMVAHDGQIVVPLITLDSLLADESPTLLKIDVEGFELFVLLGATALLERTQFIYFEAWDDHFKKNGYTFADVFDLLSSKNFEIVSFIGTSITKVSRDTAMPNCVNLLAYKNKSALEERTGWRVE
jgi:FkbM family methyltransferase